MCITTTYWRIRLPASYYSFTFNGFCQRLSYTIFSGTSVVKMSWAFETCVKFLRVVSCCVVQSKESPSFHLHRIICVQKKIARDNRKQKPAFTCSVFKIQVPQSRFFSLQVELKYSVDAFHKLFAAQALNLLRQRRQSTSRAGASLLLHVRIELRSRVYFFYVQKKVRYEFATWEKRRDKVELLHRAPKQRLGACCVQ